ncbi:MAG: AraC family transcriptional regulator [Gammaproteobacteria bacterium]|nr:AraC family transcriptional regulator [Gammaproteobacteria bacterium]
MLHTDSRDPHIIAGWLNAVAQALDARGLDSKAIFATAGIDLGAARNPIARFPAAAMSRVYELAESATGDAAFGLSIAEYVHPTSLHALGFSLLASSTLDSFCRRVVRYFRLVTTNAECQMERTASEYRLVMVPTIDGGQYIPQDAWMAMLVRFLREICQPDFAPRAVGLRRPRPRQKVQQFERFFRTEVRFGSDDNRLVFDPGDMETELPAGNAELARQNDQVVMALLARMDRDDVIARVRALFVELLPSGECDKEKVAAQLNMSERSLQSKLAARNTSYRSLLNETRQELAVQYIRQGLHSVSEVTYLLGFADISSFSRAFRSWVGVSPSEYRDRSLGRKGKPEGSEKAVG